MWKNTKRESEEKLDENWFSDAAGVVGDTFKKAGKSIADIFSGNDRVANDFGREISKFMSLEDVNKVFQSLLPDEQAEFEDIQAEGDVQGMVDFIKEKGDALFASTYSPNDTELDEGEEDHPYDAKQNADVDLKGEHQPFKDTPKKKTANMKESIARKVINNYVEPKEKINERVERLKLITEAKELAVTFEQEMAIGRIMEFDVTNKPKRSGTRVIIETKHDLKIKDKLFKKEIVVESNGKTKAVLREDKTNKIRVYRLKDKNDYNQFIRLGK